MLDQNALRELPILFEVGFLCDRIVRTLLNSSSGLISRDEEVLKEASNFLKTVKSIKDSFPPKTFGENIFKNLTIYRLALVACSGLDEKSFISEISIMLENLSLKSSDGENLTRIVNFFSKISKKTLEESRHFFKKSGYCKELINAKKLIDFEIEKILSQNRFLTRLRSEEFPTDAQDTAITLLLKVCSLLYEKLFSLSEELKNANKLPPNNREQLYQMVETAGERYDQITEVLFKLAKLIEASNVRNFPPGTFYILENVMNLFQKNASLVLSVSDEDSFSYINLPIFLRDLLRNALGKEEIKKLEENLSNYILVFNFPIFERENVLSHCLIANPIGNYITEYYTLPQKIMMNEDLSTLFHFSQQTSFSCFTE
ncbi:MAG: hypothetical protein QXV37_03985, partial [Candidatus Jordarchaeaceae archaeon]